ncbi:MAG TPA: hypothetical protein VJV78_14700 [Polyangiales bacterium]|nr:hypothetical protein [Polyangiales bacterium]
MRLASCVYTRDRRRLTTLLSAGSMLLAFGCDAQATQAYRGESLLTLLGTVEIPEPRAGGPLVPALMFQDGSSRFRLVDVGVQGEFPSNFRLDVYEAPPAQVVQQSPFPKEPAGALGYITAVPADHPDSIRFAAVVGTSGTGPCEAPGRCVNQSTWCADDGDCYQETRTCPKAESPDADCKIDGFGDPELKRPPWQMFAGFSQNYLVAYLTDEASADSYMAFALGSRDKLAPGYHLLAVREPSDEERADRADCIERSDSIAAARINEPRGTDFRPDELDGYACNVPVTCTEGFECQPTQPRDRLCDVGEPAASEIVEQFQRARELAAFELRCPTAGWILTHVPDAQDERISVKLSADANPWLRRLSGL